MMQSNWSESWSQFNGLINPDDIMVKEVRLQSSAGWYIGAAEFYDFEEMGFYSRDSEYYPSEEVLKEFFPRSLSIEEAANKIKHDPLLSRKMKRKLEKLK